MARGGRCSLDKTGAQSVLLLLLLPGSRPFCLGFCLGVVSVVSVLSRFCLGFVSVLSRFCLGLVSPLLPQTPYHPTGGVIDIIFVLNIAIIKADFLRK